MDIQVSLSLDNNKPIKLTSKNNLNYGLLQKSIRPCNIPIDSLVKYILQGTPYKCAVVKGLKDSDFVNQQLYCIDIDNDNKDYNLQTITKVQDICKSNNIPICFAYYTFSHTSTKPKFRVAFLSDTISTNKHDVELINKYLISLFVQADKVTYNASRLYLGTNKGLAIDINCDMFNYNNILNLAVKYDKETNKQLIKQYTNNTYKSSYSGDFDTLIDNIKSYSLEYMGQYTTNNKYNISYNCCNCSSGTGKNHTGITFVPKSNNTVLHCFACNWFGDIIHYHKNINNIDYIEATKELASIYNIDYDFNNYKNNNNNNNNDVEVQNKKDKKDIFGDYLNQVQFTPNYTIDFIKDVITQVPTGGGKTYNINQQILGKIINKNGQKIVYVTASNDLVVDVADRLVKEIKKILKDKTDIFDKTDVDTILDYCSILKLTIDTPKVNDFGVYDVIITNQAYLYTLGHTKDHSKKTVSLQSIINDNRDNYKIIIDEYHNIINYEYTDIQLYQLVINNDNISRARYEQLTNKYYIKDSEGNIIPSQVSYRLALLDNEVANVKEYQYTPDGLISTKYIIDNINILDTKIHKIVNVKKITNRYYLASLETSHNITINNLNRTNFDAPQSQLDFESWINTAQDIFLVKSSIVLVDNKTNKILYLYDNHIELYNNLATNLQGLKITDVEAISLACYKLINTRLTRSKRYLFSTNLFVKKDQLKFGCDQYYTTATIDNIANRCTIVKPKNIKNNNCRIKQLNITFVCIDLYQAISGTSDLFAGNIDVKFDSTANIILSEKRKIIDLKSKLKSTQTSLTNSVIHYESETKLILDDTKINKPTTRIKYSYPPETRMTGTDFSDTIYLMLDCKRSINVNQKYSRYLDNNNKLVVDYHTDTDVVFNLNKQVIGRILRGDIETKNIIICLPDINKNTTQKIYLQSEPTQISLFDNKEAQSVDIAFFNSLEFMGKIKSYFATEFSQIETNYIDLTNIKNKTHAKNKVAEILGIKNKTDNQAKKIDRDQLIRDKYLELSQDVTLAQAEILETLESDFALEKRQIYRILDIDYTKKHSYIDPMVIDFVQSFVDGKKDKTSGVTNKMIIDEVTQCFDISVREVKKLINELEQKYTDGELVEIIKSYLSQNTSSKILYNKSDIVKILINDYNISRRKAYDIFSKYNIPDK